MMNFLPSLPVFLAYTAASLLLFLTPGPDMSLFLSRTIASGRAAGIASATGANLGCVVHTLLAAFGISALVAASHTGFLVLKIVGAGYLLWLAVDAIRHGSSLNVAMNQRGTTSVWRSFVMGVMVNLTNPKVVIFFITFLPQFITAGDPFLRQKLLFFGLYFVALNIPLSIITVLIAEKLVKWLKARPRVLRGIDFTFAGVFAIFALKIAFTEGKG
jgi:threonine/homoserine/homoserine lactone efflux protein